jgi:hypothetical protein
MLFNAENIIFTVSKSIKRLDNTANLAPIGSLVNNLGKRK